MKDAEGSRIGFSGTRKGMTAPQKITVRWALENLAHQATDAGKTVYLAHGCAEGADYEAHWMAVALDFQIYGYPATHPYKGFRVCDFMHIANREGPLTRNQLIVDFSEILIAAPAQPMEIRRSGTWATVRYMSKKQPVATLLVTPDGEAVWQ